jgi:hypothetical protein
MEIQRAQKRPNDLSRKKKRKKKARMMMNKKPNVPLNTSNIPPNLTT